MLETSLQPETAVPIIDPRPELRAFLVLDAFVRMCFWMFSFAAATAAITAMHQWPTTPLFNANFRIALGWAVVLGNWIVIFNYAYVSLLLVLRLPIPTPRAGVYSTAKKLDFRKTNDRQLLWASLIATLTKARYQAPFPAFLVFHVCNIPPLVWLMGPIFGPRSKSCYVSEPLVLDPAFVEIGRNVVIGSNATLAGHIQVRDMVQIRKTRIDDDVLIGANCIVFGGVHIKRGAMVAGGSVIPPYTTIGENEYWSGVPAVKIRDLPPPLREM